MTIITGDPNDSTASVSGDGLGSRGGTRGDAYAVEVVVAHGGSSAVGATVTFSGTTTVSATTDDNGVATINLPAGSYTVKATSEDTSASTDISVVPSTDPLIVSLSLG